MLRDIYDIGTFLDSIKDLDFPDMVSNTNCHLKRNELE